jgi:FkbM family methyltransferase
MSDIHLPGPQRSAYASLTRAGSDTLAVIRGARSISALEWLLGLVTHAPDVVHSGSLRPADVAWRRRGARFRTPSGRSVFLPGDLTAGAREMYCRNVYLRTGLRIPTDGWVVDLGANAGLFTVLAAVEGARVVAVEAQRDFGPEISRLLTLNWIGPQRVHIETAFAAAAGPQIPHVGVLADDERWQTASHAAPERPAAVSVPDLMSRHGIDRIGLVKMDIEGSEFSVLHPDSDLSWLSYVDQITMEVHPAFGDLEQIHRTLLRHRFGVRITNNEGDPVAAGSSEASYAYCRRLVLPAQH